MNYVNFNDESIPVGKRKQAYVKWAVSKGTSLIDARRQANRKFGARGIAGIRCAPNHYLIIENYNRRVTVLNCSCKTAPSDIVLMELPKEIWWNLNDIAEQEGRRISTKKDFEFFYNKYKERVHREYHESLEAECAVNKLLNQKFL